MRKISLLIICLLITGCKGAYTTIDSNVAMDLVEDNHAILIDVRSIEEYNREHIEGAVNIPLDMINSIDYELDETIIVYCQSGMRSMEAAKMLSKMGYTNLYNLDGGLLNWGFDLIKGE